MTLRIEPARASREGSISLLPSAAREPCRGGAELHFKASISSNCDFSITINCDNGFFDYIFISTFYFVLKRNEIRLKYPLLRAKRQETLLFTFDFQNVGMQCACVTASAWRSVWFLKVQIIRSYFFTFYSQFIHEVPQLTVKHIAYWRAKVQFVRVVCSFQLLPP